MINPSAWMVGNNLCRRLEQAEMHHEFSGDPIVPLYPAKTLTEIIEKNKPEIEKANAYIKSLKDEIESLKAKTLTDEDIEPLILKMPYEPSENELYEFAYDVLRKAQEK